MTKSNNYSINKLNGNDRLNSAEVGTLLFVLMITFKTCNMPSVLYSASGESGVWCIAILVALDAILLVLSLLVASKGGIQKLNIPKTLKIVICCILFCFFLFKFAAFCYEATTSIQSVLFEKSLVYPILFAIILTAALLGSKGFTGVGRTTLIFGWASIFILIFNIFFIGFDGFEFNLFPIFQFKNIAGGVIKQAMWFGEPLILMLVDFSPNPTTKQKVWIGTSFIISALTLIGFFILMIFTYGSLSDSVTNAFSRVLTMNKYSNELGAVDWPIIILWLVMSILHLAILVAALRKCFIQVTDFKPKNKTVDKIIFYSIILIVPVIFYFLVFDDLNYTKIISSNIAGITTLIVSYLLPIIIVLFDRLRGKEIKNENKKKQV